MATAIHRANVVWGHEGERPASHMEAPEYVAARSSSFAASSRLPGLMNRNTSFAEATSDRMLLLKRPSKGNFTNDDRDAAIPGMHLA